MKTFLVVVLTAVAGAVQAQHQPYAGQESRDIKALSAKEIEQYRAGAGMGYAKAAELNRYPGPMHVLELAEKLKLSPEQRQATKQLMDAHKAEARAIGARVVDAEGRLEALFRRGQVRPEELATAVQEAATLQGEYRLAHLETHRRLRAILTDPQVAQYDVLRGYASKSGSSGHKH
jgi:hypothetical protein